MRPYGQIKTRNPSKNSSHRNCPICDPDEGNKARARQSGKKEIRKQIGEMTQTEWQNHIAQIIFK